MIPGETGFAALMLRFSYVQRARRDRSAGRRSPASSAQPVRDPLYRQLRDLFLRRLGAIAAPPLEPIEDPKSYEDVEDV